VDSGFKPGLNIVTGETGSGKSILIEALNLCCGKRASVDIVRTGEETTVLECEILDSKGSAQIIRRVIRVNGSSRAFLNDEPVKLYDLEEFTQPDGRAFDGFGYSVDISGGQIAVGVHSPNSPSEATNHGRVHVYERDQGGPNQWGLARKITPIDGPHSDYFGSSVALSNDMLNVCSALRSPAYSRDAI